MKYVVETFDHIVLLPVVLTLDTESVAEKKIMASACSGAGKISNIGAVRLYFTFTCIPNFSTDNGLKYPFLIKKNPQRPKLSVIQSFVLGSCIVHQWLETYACDRMN